MLIFVVWLTIVILCGIVASNRHRSVGGWVLLGALFSLPAFLVLLALKPRDPNAALPAWNPPQSDRAPLSARLQAYEQGRAAR